MNTELNQPRTFLKFKSCAHCQWQPCERLRYGGVFPGKSMVVSRSDAPPNPVDCPFLVTDPEQLRIWAEELSMADLVEQTEFVLSQLDVNMSFAIRQSHFVMSYDDREGRIRLLLALWSAGGFALLRIPHHYGSDDKMRRWLHSLEALTPTVHHEAQEQEPAATDDVEAAPAAETVRLMNPRWEHADETAAQERPEETVVGDTILLKADVEGIPDGAMVSFDVYDLAYDPPSRIAGVRGANTEGTAEAEWKVELADTNRVSGKVAFEATVRSKVSERVEVPVTEGPFAILLHIDVDDPEARDDQLKLVDADGNEVLLINVADMKEIEQDVVRLTFPDIDMDTKYSLIRDYGSDEDGGEDPLFVDMTLNEIKELYSE